MRRDSIYKWAIGSCDDFKFGWYLAIAPNEMFSLYEYPVPGKSGVPLCQEHVRQLESKYVLLFDWQSNEAVVVNLDRTD